MTMTAFDYIIKGMKRDKTNRRVYICHTYYHVYISVVKELIRRRESNGSADIILSTMSNNFESLEDRLSKSGVFENIIRIS